MILESTQILYTCQHLNGATVVVESAAPVCKSTGKRGYKKISPKHPSVKWAAASLAHYKWLCEMALCLVDEHEYRFGTDRHSCEVHLRWLAANPPADLLEKRWLSDPTPAMPDEYKVEGNVEQSYWNYYNGSKQERGLFKWTGRHVPHVFRIEPYKTQ
jgi:hypothetical protein